MRCNADDSPLEAVDVSADFSPALLLPEQIQSGKVAGGGGGEYFSDKS